MEIKEKAPPLEVSMEAIERASAAMKEVYFDLSEKYYSQLEVYCQKLVDAGIGMNDVVIQEYPIRLVETDDPDILRIQGRFSARFKTDEEKEVAPT